MKGPALSGKRGALAPAIGRGTPADRRGLKPRWGWKLQKSGTLEAETAHLITFLTAETAEVAEFFDLEFLLGALGVLCG